MVAEGERQPILVAGRPALGRPHHAGVSGLVIAQVPTVPMLHADFSPGVQPTLAATLHITPLVLTRLERPQVEALITQRVGGKPSRSKWCSTSSPKRMGCRCMLKS